MFKTSLAFRDHVTYTCVTASIGHTWERELGRTVQHAAGTFPKERPHQSAGTSLSALLSASLSSLSSPVPHTLRIPTGTLLPQRSFFNGQWSTALTFHYSAAPYPQPQIKKICNDVSRAQSSDLSSNGMLSSKGSSVPHTPRIPTAHAPFTMVILQWAPVCGLVFSMILPLLNLSPRSKRSATMFSSAHLRI